MLAEVQPAVPYYALDQSRDFEESNMTAKSMTPAPNGLVESSAGKLWVEPEIRELNVRETMAFPGEGADVGGNPFPDCQLS
ncbi:MAG: hypothetical protein IPL75_06815 [Acidobacteria bacterium]|nr:hypothetical protein [Acidobacteriota bacterium]